MPTLSDVFTSNTENRPQLLAAVTPKPKDATIADTPQTGPTHAAMETAGAAERSDHRPVCGNTHGERR